jgi:hypothetical protein
MSLTKATVISVTHDMSENLIVSINEESNDSVCSEQMFASGENEVTTN